MKIKVIDKYEPKVLRIYGKPNVNYSWYLYEFKAWRKVFSSELFLFFLTLNVDTLFYYRYARDTASKMLPFFPSLKVDEYNVF